MTNSCFQGYLIPYEIKALLTHQFSNSSIIIKIISINVVSTSQEQSIMFVVVIACIGFFKNCPALTNEIFFSFRFVLLLSAFITIC